jgi:hypothetical protein
MFFIHVDRKKDPGQFRYMVRQHKNVRFVWPRVLIEWGGWSMVQAELTLVRWALRAGATHVTLLSGMDYPVWCNRRIAEAVAGGRNFMEHYRIPSVFWDRGAVNRVRQYWVCDDPIPLRSRLWQRTFGRIWRFIWHRIIRRVSNLALKLGFEVGLHRKPPNGLVQYVGSQWWSFTRECAQYVIDYVAHNPNVVRYYRHSHVPDEGFFQTVLLNSPLAGKIENTSMRYIEWDGAFNPRVLDANDLAAIVKSGCMFARKLVLGAAKEPNGRMVSSDALINALELHRHAEEAAFVPGPAKLNGSALVEPVRASAVARSAAAQHSSPAN